VPSHVALLDSTARMNRIVLKLITVIKKTFS
jgi:hypothetical protein